MRDQLGDVVRRAVGIGRLLGLTTSQVASALLIGAGAYLWERSECAWVRVTEKRWTCQTRLDPPYWRAGVGIDRRRREAITQPAGVGMRELRNGPSRRKQMVVFARNFFRHPKILGSVVPSSRFLIREVLGHVDWDRARVIVEFGPGVGNFTTAILRRMRPDARLLAVELNEAFVRFLSETIDDARLEVVHDSAESVQRILEERVGGAADYIISGIPFSTLPPQTRGSILKRSRAALAPDGAMLVYQFSRRVLPHLEEEFASVKRGFEPLNVLPAQVFRCSP